MTAIVHPPSLSSPSWPPFRTQCDDPVVFVPTPADARPAELELPEDAKPKLMIDVIHDGDVIPEELLIDKKGMPISADVFGRYYANERDWGACMVASEIARQLGLGGFWRIEIARVVMDFGRFPGITRKDSTHLGRHAINYPFSGLLTFEQMRRILEHYYDAISNRFNAIVQPVQVKIAIHTYDSHNSSGTRRPPVSILTRCVGYQNASEMPIGVFDPLYPDILGEFTSDRILRDRLSLTLERAGLHTEHNYPYLLPDGSVEVRSQVWNFFHLTRQGFEAEHPETVNDPVFLQVWEMLLDTNLRSSESEALRSYMHAFRRVPAERELEFAQARRAYERIANFLRRDGQQYIELYRHSRERPSALGIEIRKDLIYDFDEDGHPVAPRPREARKIASVLARAIHIYFTEDCQADRVFW